MVAIRKLQLQQGVNLWEKTGLLMPFLKVLHDQYGRLTAPE